MLPRVYEPHTAVIEQEDMPLYAPELDQMTVDSEQALAPRPAPPQRPVPVPVRAPRLYAYD